MGVNLLGKIKIYDIAKKLDLTSKEVLEVAKALNIEVKSHLSGVEEGEAKKIEDALAKVQKETKKESGNKAKDKNDEDVKAKNEKTA